MILRYIIVRSAAMWCAAVSVRHDYVTQNGKVVRETVTTDGTVTAVMDFIYDESGSPFALRHSTNGSSFTTYYYVLNLQGDVVKLVNANGTAYATYTYNAWGKLLTATGDMASVNPLRYRGYYYDNETGFYYLQSRYYDPANHRFLNADIFTSTDETDAVACNMFAYCNNNPSNRTDASGYKSSSEGDSNQNGIPDYLELHWRRQTIKALQQIKKSTNVTVRNIDGKVAVDCSVDFRVFEFQNGDSSYLDDEMYRYVVCKELEENIRNEENKQIDSGMELAGTMSFGHIYQELTFHFCGYRTLPTWTSYYDSCVIADLNYDENRLICRPMRWIEVPSY